MTVSFQFPLVDDVVVVSTSFGNNGDLQNGTDARSLRELVRGGVAIRIRGIGELVVQNKVTMFDEILRTQVNSNY
jgi:hypothetical protein